MTEYLTVEEVAKLLKVSERTVYNWIGSGKLPALKFGDNWRITQADLDKFSQPSQAV